MSKRYGYYPGCSLASSGKEYGQSTRAVCGALGVDLWELPDWNCCGASSAHSLDRGLDLALSARNISLAQREGLEMVVPCAACYNRTASAWQTLRDDPPSRETMEKELNFTFREDLGVHHLLHVIDGALAGRDDLCRGEPTGNDIGVRKVVCYHGCLINRPRGINPHEDMEAPVTMARILERFGYVPLRWSYATECCGASLSLTRHDVVTSLVDRIISAAAEAGADAIVTACPLCQVNLESRQLRRFSVFYFTELLGAALGLPEATDWWKLHLVDVRATQPPATTATNNRTGTEQ